MPVIDVILVVAPDERVDGECSSRIAQAASQCLGSRPGGTWVTFRTIGENNYAEDNGGPPDGVRPAFVRVLLFDTGDLQQRRIWARDLADALSPILKRPTENIHIFFEPPGRGRVAFGGQLREEQG